MTAPATLPVTQIGPPVPFPSSCQITPLRERFTTGGRCLFREIRLNTAVEDAVLDLWKRNKRAFLERGWAVRKENHTWYVMQWLYQPQDGAVCHLTQEGQSRIDEYLMPTAGLELVDLPPEYPALPGGIEKKLYGYQVQPARQLLRALVNGRSEWGYPGANDLSDTGIGKTFQDLAAALSTGRKICVLCPTVGEAGWRKAFAHFGAEPHYISTYEAVRMGVRSHIATCDPSTGKWTWKNPHEIILILDEAQALRRETTLTVRCCSGAIAQGIPIICASATIALSPVEMRFSGRITGLHQGAEDWERFLVRHGCYRQRGNSGEFKWNGNLRHLQDINRTLFPRRGCRVRKEDLGEACPETEIKALPIHIAEEREIEEEWANNQRMLDNLRRQGKSTVVAERQLRMATWRKCEMLLVEEVSKRVKADLAAGYSVAVFMNFNDSRLALSRLLNTSAGFYGGQQIERRKYYEREFQADRIHVLVSNIGAGGASVSLHDERGERPRRAYVFPTDNPVHMSQAFGRVPRVGSKSKSVQYIPYVAGAMTEQMVQRTRIKMRNFSTLNDGRASKAQF